MRYFAILILLIPQLLYAQYQSKEFTLPSERSTTCQNIGIFTKKDTIVTLNINQKISGLFVSGTATLGNTQDSYARVTIKDRYDVEHLVYENYPLLSDDNPSCFSKIAVESVLLDDIVPTSMKIEIFDASVQIDSIYYSAAQNLSQSFPARARAIHQEQTQALANKLNAHLRENRMPWFAGCTPIALKSFEEKKQMFGPKVPCLHGFDYYMGGLYVISPNQIRTLNQEQYSMRSNSYVNDFDWRNRHGKNWITSVKQQRKNTCWDFATVATIESNFNIYFNQVFEDSITNNLSEQELVSCLDNDWHTIAYRLDTGGIARNALDYVKRKGIVRESCFPWIGNVSCDNKCSNPTEQVSFSSFRNLYWNNSFTGPKYAYTDAIADSLRKAVIKSPVVVDHFRNGGHSVSCIGFHQIQMGDTLCQNFASDYHFVVDSTTSYYINKISWIIKNSWGSGWGENGFAKLTFIGDTLRLYETIPPFTSLIYSDGDRCVTDNDMDGYYTWGSGSKPANLPVWIPNQQDGDDTNSSIGAIDGYGNCDTLTISPAVTWYIDSNVNYNSTDYFTYPNIVIVQDGTLNITDAIMTMKRNATINVQDGGRLIINGGQICEANIIVENGGTLIIDHGGLIQLSHNGQYITHVGAKVSINYGWIK